MRNARDDGGTDCRGVSCNGQDHGFSGNRSSRPQVRAGYRALKGYNEFVIPLSEKDTRDQAARCMNCGIPYCHGTGSVQPHARLPGQQPDPDWNDLVYTGNWEEASRNLHSTNNFPEFTGRICPAPCEASCTLNIDDNPSPSRPSNAPSSTRHGTMAG